MVVHYAPVDPAIRLMVHKAILAYLGKYDPDPGDTLTPKDEPWPSRFWFVYRIRDQFGVLRVWLFPGSERTIVGYVISLREEELQIE